MHSQWKVCLLAKAVISILGFQLAIQVALQTLMEHITQLKLVQVSIAQTNYVLHVIPIQAQKAITIARHVFRMHLFKMAQLDFVSVTQASIMTV